MIEHKGTILKEVIQDRVNYILKDLLVDKKIINVTRNINTIRKEIENDEDIFNISYRKIGIDASRELNRFDYEMIISTRKDGIFHLLLNATSYCVFGSIKDIELKTFEEFRQQKRYLYGDYYTPIVHW